MAGCVGRPNRVCLGMPLLHESSITSHSSFTRMVPLSTCQMKACLTSAGFIDSYGTPFSQATSLATLYTYE